MSRPRLRELGIVVGRFEPGDLNAITDVPGVHVGHATLCHAGDDPDRPARTGVTAILPNRGDTFMDRVVGGAFVLNGAGEMAGLIQVMEWGLIETPILLTNTLAVGTAAHAAVQYMLGKYPGIGRDQDVVIPLVGECDDSFLNDIGTPYLRAEHVFAALDNASTGPVAEGNVGGGTGMVSFDLKGGIGTSSRRLGLATEASPFHLGVLVMTNVGRLEDLRVDGVPVGQILDHRMPDALRRDSLYGSIITVLATDAPLRTHQIQRLCKRAALGLGRVGSYAAHGSGEIVVGFSTANTIPRPIDRSIHQVSVLSDRDMDPLYQAAIEATEEAVLNALCAAEDMVGVNQRCVRALPLDDMVEIYQRCRGWI